MRFCFILAGVLALGLASAAPAVSAGPGLRARSVIRVDSRGRLVRQVVTPALEGKPARERVEYFRRKARVDELVEEAAKKYGVDPLLIHSVIQVESSYNPFAVSPKGAEGLMQLIPETARRFGVANPFDPKQNIDAGVRYLKYLKDLFRDDRLALAAYNAGEGAVARYKWIPPYRETREYLRRVAETYAELKRKAEKTTGSSSPSDGPQYRPVESYTDSEGRLHLRTR